MKTKLFGLFLLFIMLAVAVTTASAHGGTSSQLENAGWFCFNAGPNNWTHCNPPGTNMKNAPPATIQVKVFGEEGHPFLGTEILVRADLYSGQPCATDGGETYHFLGEEFPYYACHHFSTH